MGVLYEINIGTINWIILVKESIKAITFFNKYSYSQFFDSQY